MIRSRQPLLDRLRRHRGLWVLALAVLLFKLASSSVCLADTPSTKWNAGPTATQSALVASDFITPGDNGCILGEPGECHCTCAHSSTVPVTVTLRLVPMAVDSVSPHATPDLLPRAVASPLRPPIA